nr:hypothetical protein [Anaerolineae bacterium]
MDKKFTVLRIIGTIWKILAWIALIVGILSSIGILLTSVLGGEMLRQFGQRPGLMPWTPWAFGLAGGVVMFIVSLVATVIYFLMLYAVGELIYLLLAIEENTRLAAQWIQARPAPAAHPAAPSVYSPPPPPPPPVPEP